MKSSFKQGTIIHLLSGIQKDPMRFFRKVSAAAIESDTRLYGPAWLHFFNKKQEDDAVKLPVQATYFQKFVVTVNERKEADCFIQATGSVRNITPIIAGSINPLMLKAPKDGHLRWQAGIPENQGVCGYAKIGGNVYHINPLTNLNYGSNTPAIADIQCVKSPIGIFTFHCLLTSGEVYRTDIDSRQSDTDRTIPLYTKIKNDFRVNSLLTFPNAGNEIVEYFATDNGILTNHGDMIQGTEGMQVMNITADSEANRIYFRTAAGDIYAMKYNQNGSVVVKPVAIGNIGNYQWMLAGPNVKTEDNIDGLLLSGWNKTADAHCYIHVTKVIPIPVGII